MQVTVRNPLFGNDRYHFDQPEFFTYVGESSATLKHVGTDSLALTTGIEDWPIRVIPRSWIESIDGTAYTQPSSQITTRIVKGSKVEEYVVTMGAKPTCTCTGFQFRRTCKHIL
jgi:hypothetical protein